MPLAIDPFKTATAAGTGVLNTISAVWKTLVRADNATKQQSLANFTSAARVEPLAIISSDCIHVEELPMILQSVNSLFAAYYLQAISLIGTVDKVQVVKLLDQLNPTRDGVGKLANWAGDAVMGRISGESITEPDWRMAQESYKDRLPTSFNTLAMEEETKKIKDGPQEEKTKNKDGIVLDDKSKNAIASTIELSNLSVGKLISVTITMNGQQITLPISVRLLVNQIPDSSLEYLLTLPASDDGRLGFIERYHAWRSGRITFIKDLILCQDLIDAHKKALMKDTQGVYSEVVARANGHKIAGFVSGQPSLASASNIYVISDTVAEDIEDKLGGKLSNPHIRDKIFSTGYGMFIVVVNKTWDNVTFYIRGLASGSTLGFRDLKAAAKGTGPDIGEILKAYQLGNNVQF